MKDIVGNEFAIGDLVATDVTYRRSSALRVGTVAEVDEHGNVKVLYPVLSGYGFRKKIINRSVWRTPSGVVKVAPRDGV